MQEKNNNTQPDNNTILVGVIGGAVLGNIVLPGVGAIIGGIGGGALTYGLNDSDAPN